VVAPPPTPTIASLRVIRLAASWDHRAAATLMSLAASPAGTSAGCTWYPASLSARMTGPLISSRPFGAITITVAARGPISGGSSPSTPVPTTTS
jgi:hypothetical protein